MYWLSGYLYWGDWQKLEDKTDWTQTSDQERRYQESHFWTAYRLTKHEIDWDTAECVTCSTTANNDLTLESWYTNSARTSEPMSTATCILQTTNTWPQTKPTNNRRIENLNSKTTTDQSLQRSRFDDQSHHDKTGQSKINYDQRHRYCNEGEKLACLRYDRTPERRIPQYFYWCFSLVQVLVLLWN